MLNLHTKISLPKNKEYDFFRNNNLSDWTISFFKQHQSNNARIQPKMNVIINQYKQRLVDISGFVKDEDVKQYIADFLKDVGNKAKSKRLKVVLKILMSKNSRLKSNQV